MQSDTIAKLKILNVNLKDKTFESKKKMHFVHSTFSSIYRTYEESKKHLKQIILKW